MLFLFQFYKNKKNGIIISTLASPYVSKQKCLTQKDIIKMKLLVTIFALMLSLATSPLQAANSEANPFAEQKVVLQISDPNPFKQTLVLNVASNIIKHYGQDKVDIEIVAFGPGLRLLLDGNSNQSRISGLSQSGVRFAACENTIKAYTKKLGYTPKLVPQATPVSAGVVRILELTKQGYTLIKP